MLRKAKRPWDALDEVARERLEDLIRHDYARSRPGDTLDGLKRRARFSKGDAGLLRDWLEVAQRRAADAKEQDPSEKHKSAA